MRVFRTRLVCLGLAILFCGGFARAQQDSSQQEPPPGQHPATNAPPPGTPQGSPTPSPTDKNNEKEIEKKEQSQRVLGIYPQFSVTSRKDASALTPGGKFHLFVKSALDPFEFVVAGLQAGADQAEDEFPEYGQGAQGFGKRYAADFGDSVSSGFFSNFFWPVLLKEDPRYFRLGTGSFKRRFGYSLAQEFVCHTDKGGRFVNLSNILGAFSSGALSNTYHPQSDRGVGLTARGASYALFYGSVGGLLSEFWPDLSRKIHRHHKDSAPVSSATPSP
jgi:hypothetical protein